MPSLKDADSLVTKMQEHLSNRFTRELSRKLSESSHYFSLPKLAGLQNHSYWSCAYLHHCLNLFLQELVSGAGWIQQEEWHKKWGIKGLENKGGVFWLLLFFGGFLGFFFFGNSLFKLCLGVAIPTIWVSPCLSYLGPSSYFIIK